MVMKRFFTRAAILAVLTAVGLGVFTTTAAAQAIPFRSFPSAQYNNPSFIPTTLQTNQFRQFAYNTAFLGRTYRNIPPWLLGYNPYPPINLGPVYQPITPYGYGGYSPTPYNNPYSSGGGYTNPYASGGAGGGYTSGGYPGTSSYGSSYGGGGGYTSGYDPYSSYSSDPYGGYLRGEASLANAFGQQAIQIQQANLLAEMVKQAKLDTKKKAFDTAAYFRDNTPTFSQEQAKIQRQTLQRIQTTANPIEIQSGKSLNILLDSLKKQVGKKAPVATPSLEEDVLKHLNVTSKGKNLGLLRNNGQFTWPVALRNREIADPTQLTSIEKEAHRLFRQAADARPDLEGLGNLEKALGQIRDTLTKKVNDVPTRQYLDAQRFLDDFEAAIAALSAGDAIPYFDFQQKFSGGGKTAQELVEYMHRNGLRFAPAVLGDEAAYQAAHTALVAYSVALDNQVAHNKE